MRTDHRLFYESAEDAITEVVNGSSRSWKEVATMLWPAMKIESAYARLKNCLRDDKDEKLSFAEVIQVCKFCERFDALYHFADECHHTRGEPRAPEDEAAVLKREFVTGVRSLEKLAERLERLEGRA